MNNKNQWLREVSRNKDLWAKELDDIPAMIKSSYVQLKNLAEDGQVYGVMLLCKDLYESLIKNPVIMSLIIIDSDPKYKEGSAYTDIIKASLCEPMSMGKWNALAAIVVKKNKYLHLPDSLIEVLKRTRKLYAAEITSDVPNIINWRNDTIGHGALKFEDDESYIQEISTLIFMLREYFDGTEKYSIKGLYRSIYFTLNGTKLVGDNDIIPQDENEIALFVDSVKYEAGHYANTHSLRYYLFDSFYYRKSLTKYSSYSSGQSELVKNNYFTDLYEKIVFKAGKNFNLHSELISREEDILLEYLNTPLSYVKPVYIIEQLCATMEELEHGIIALFMERGTGKSAFSNQMSGLYHKVPLINDSFSRCYHVQNASLKGKNDFLNSVNFSFRHSFDPAQDLWGSIDEMPSLHYDTSKPAEEMADFLNYYHEKYSKEYTILLIDGIDEITEQTREILDYIPSPDRLDDGVFIILLSRYKEEETVLGKSKEYIEFAETVSQVQLQINRKSEDNIKLLSEYINQYIKAGKFPIGIDCDELVKRADYRFLFLKAYLGIKAEIILDNKNEYSLISSYMNYLLSFYGPSQKNTIKEIAVTISLFPSISIHDYQEYMNCMDITCEFVGLLNDLLPIMTVWHVNGENVYSFADEAYAEFFLEEFADVTEEVIKFFYLSMANNLQEYFHYGSLLRIDTSKKSMPEKDLNKAIIFFSEGLLSIWSRALNNETIRNIFFSNLYGAHLCVQVCFDNWSSEGYGLYLREELISCLGAALYYCIQKPEEKNTVRWCEEICLNNEKKDEEVIIGLENLKWILANKKEFNNIYKYIVEHPDLDKLDLWLWVLEEKTTEDTITVLKTREGLLDEFIDYLIVKDITGYKTLKWTEMLLESGLTPIQEERLLNLQLKIYSSIDRLNMGNLDSERAKECLSIIRSKGYSVLDTIFPGATAELLKQIEEGNLVIEQIRKRKDQAVTLLLDFETPWSHDADKASPEFEVYLEIKHGDGQAVLAHKEIEELNSAIYKRMCFERDNGDLGYFVETEILLDDFILDILKNEVGSEEEYYHELESWTSVFRRISNKDHQRSIKLLSVLMIEEINWLTSRQRLREAESLLENYVFNYDTLAFFAAYFSYGIVTSAIEPNIIYKDSYVYCTNNAIYLLDYYLTKREDGKFKSLMEKIEKDIPQIDSDHKATNETQAMCDVAKYKFMKYRKAIGYVSAFDDYLNSTVINHKNVILDELRTLSKNSDFNAIEFHLELLLEYAWQTGQWNTGIELCDDMINAFGSKVSTYDSVVKQSLEHLVVIPKLCKKFFLFINGDEYEAVKKEEQEYFLMSSCFLLRDIALFDKVKDFLESYDKKERTDYLCGEQIILVPMK